MDCKECGGVVSNAIFVKTGCGPPSSPAYVCEKCGRLHWEDGSPVFNRAGNPAFIKDGGLVIKDAKTSEECKL